jgi:hypothetical protein
MGRILVVTLPLLVLAPLQASCAKPVGSEGGPCTEGGACDPGLTCASDLCVKLGSEGEGEGEGDGSCFGDEAPRHDRGDCQNISAAACAAVDENAAVQTCDTAGAILRTGLFNEAFECIAEIDVTKCLELDSELDKCFAALTACPLPAADDLCTQADEQCVSEGDNGFPVDACVSDLTSTNQAFRSAYADCFNNSGGTACSDVHDDCYNTALNTLVGG